jgi:hypothetical protein
VPTGTYKLVDRDGWRFGTESFRCAPGPAGWRYVSDIQTDVPKPHHETIDLAADEAWRPVRVRIETGEHELLLRREGHRLIGHRDTDEVELEFPNDRELDYLSPAFNAVTAMRWGRTIEFDVWFFDPGTIEPRPTRQRYEHRGEEVVVTAAGRFPAIRWGYEALDTGYASEFWTAGDVVVKYTGYLELETYEPGANGARPVD